MQLCPLSYLFHFCCSHFSYQLKATIYYFKIVIVHLKILVPVNCYHNMNNSFIFLVAHLLYKKYDFATEEKLQPMKTVNWCVHVLLIGSHEYFALRQLFFKGHKEIFWRSRSSDMVSSNGFLHRVPHQNSNDRFFSRFSKNKLLYVLFLKMVQISR